MAEEKGPTKQESEKLAKANLANEQLRLLSAIYMMKDYGPKFEEKAQSLVYAGVRMPPTKEVHEQLYLPQLINSDGTLKEDGAITTPYLQKNSFIIIQKSLASLKVKDLVKYAGVKGEVPKGIGDKYASDLDEKEVSQLVGMAMYYQSGEMAKKVISLEQDQISGGLERMLIPQKEGKERTLNPEMRAAA